jgi:sugar phosphate isomerase/epimerase
LIESALSYGFKGLELDLVEFDSRVQGHGLEHARRLFDSAKLRFGFATLPFSPAADDSEFQAGLKTLSGLAEMSATVGCTRWVTNIEPASDERPYHSNFEFYRQRLGAVAQALEPHGIRLGVGFRAAPALRQDKAFEFIHGFDATQMLVGMAGASNLGLSIDLWQIFASGASVDLVRKLSAGQVVAVFLSDAATGTVAGSADEESRELPGENGSIDAVAALVMLAEMAYDGPVTPTSHPARLAGQGRQAILKLTRDRLDAVWKNAGLTPSGKLAAPLAK